MSTDSPAMRLHLELSGDLGGCARQLRDQVHHIALQLLDGFELLGLA